MDAVAVAEAAAEILVEALALRPRASLAFPGGSCARNIVPVLAGYELDWRRIDITLADERLVPPDHAWSNEHLLRGLLWGKPGDAAAFHSWWGPKSAEAPPDPAALSARLPAVMAWPLDLLLLGLAEDGHIASLFPESPSLTSEEPVLLKTPAPMPGLEGKPQGADRLTLSPRAIAAARCVFLVFSGEARRRQWEAAQSGNVVRHPAAMLLSHPRLRVFDLPDAEAAQADAVAAM
jgi:6-phosphogluconolactonase